MNNAHPRISKIVRNRLATRGVPYGEIERWVLSHERATEALSTIQTWEGYNPTPLWELPRLAEKLGVKDILYKDESSRFGLDSFKALGGTYGVWKLILRELARQTGRKPKPDILPQDPAFRKVAQTLTVTTATDGNHGRAVAFGAKIFGCRAEIFLPQQVSPSRESAIRALGARTHRTDLNYDETVRIAAQAASENGWYVVSDTSYEGYVDTPRDVMQGYTVLAREIVDQWEGERPIPTHLFVQGGVGGLAAAVTAHLWEQWQEDRPITAIVEPETAACILATGMAGSLTTVPGPHTTIMAGLACGETSPLAWEIIQRSADWFLSIPDSAAAHAMRVLAFPLDGDPEIVAGESGAAGLAGFLAVAEDPDARASLGLNSASSILLIGSEGATDRDSYDAIIGA